MQIIVGKSAVRNAQVNRIGKYRPSLEPIKTTHRHVPDIAGATRVVDECTVDQRRMSVSRIPARVETDGTSVACWQPKNEDVRSGECCLIRQCPQVLCSFQQTYNSGSSMIRFREHRRRHLRTAFHQSPRLQPTQTRRCSMRVATRPCCLKTDRNQVSHCIQGRKIVRRRRHVS